MADEKRERYINPYTDFGYRDIVNAINTAKKEAKEECRAEGIAEGAAKEKISVARNLKSMGLGVDDIAKATGLTEEQIVHLD